MSKSLKVASLAAAIALAMGSTAAFAAAPTATQLPGQGKIVAGAVSAGTITNGVQTITIGDATSGNAVINWGSGTDINKTGVGGFNVGSSATLHFAGANATSNAVLNVDSSGNPSQIMGTVDTTGTAVSVFVANQNGIIVGAGGSVTASGDVGLIANIIPADQSGTVFTGAAPDYNGTGGDVTVQSGASLSGATVLVTGGGNVNVDLGALTSGAATLMAGTPSTSGFTSSNDAATLTVSGALPTSGGTLVGFMSAGNATNNGTLDLTDAAGNDDVAGTFTNAGTLSHSDGISGNMVNQKTMTADAGATFGSLTNDGDFTAAGAVSTDAGGLTNSGQFTASGATSVTGGDFTNNGSFTGTGVTVTGGNLMNNGSLTGTGTATVADGSITNVGKLIGFSTVSTTSDSADDAFAAAADYSITNSGAISSTGALTIHANTNHAGGTDNDSTGSFTNTGTLQVASTGNLTASAYNNLALGGSLMAGTKAISATNELGTVALSAGDTLTVSAPVFFGGATADFTGSQVSLMSDITGGTADSPAGDVTISAEGAPTGGYAVRVAAGKTVSADTITVTGADMDGDGNADGAPNVILQGTLSGATSISLGGGFDAPVSDVFSGAAGGLVSDDVTIYFNGALKSAPYLNASNFRYNYLPISAPSGTLALALEPVDYKTNGTSNGLSAVNLLVNGDVNLAPVSYSGTPGIFGSDTAVTGVDTTPNTHLVLQSTGSIATTTGNFYWPGYVYFGTIDSSADGSPLPGTLGGGTITLGGNFSNVLPGSVANAGGIHFITANPLDMSQFTVTTNANSWINFGTDLLTQNYAAGILGVNTTTGDTLFYGGTQGAGTVVNYDLIDSSMFHTQAPVGTK